MTKNLLRTLFSTVCMLALALVAEAQCYIIGNDNNWVTNMAGAELQATATDGVYEGDVTFTDSYYFFVATQLTEDPADWAGLEPYRYNPGSVSEKNIVYGVPSKLYTRAEGIDGSFMVSDLGVHHITVDLNEKTIVVEGTYPEHLYLIGSDNAWQPGVPSATLTRDENSAVYRATVEFTGNYFALYTDLADEWSEQNQYRWKTTASLEPNQEYYLVQSAEEPSMNIVRLATYEVIVDWASKSIQLYDPTYVPDAPKKYVYFIGNDNSWNPSTCFGQLEESEKENVYEGDVTFGEGYFAIGTTLGKGESDWATFNATRYCPSENGLVMEDNSAADLYAYDEASGMNGAFQVTTAGTYSVKVDLDNLTLTFGTPEPPTAITGVQTTATAQPYYDLSGRSLGTKKPAKGVYIKGGKKVVVAE